MAERKRLDATGYKRMFVKTMIAISPEWQHFKMFDQTHNKTKLLGLCKGLGRKGISHIISKEIN